MSTTSGRATKMGNGKSQKTQHSLPRPCLFVEIFFGRGLTDSSFTLSYLSFMSGTMLPCFSLYPMFRLWMVSSAFKKKISVLGGKEREKCE